MAKYLDNLAKHIARERASAFAERSDERGWRCCVHIEQSVSRRAARESGRPGEPEQQQQQQSLFEELMSTNLSTGLGFKTHSTHTYTRTTQLTVNSVEFKNLKLHTEREFTFILYFYLSGAKISSKNGGFGLKINI